MMYDIELPGKWSKRRPHPLTRASSRLVHSTCGVHEIGTGKLHWKSYPKSMGCSAKKNNSNIDRKEPDCSRYLLDF